MLEVNIIDKVEVIIEVRLIAIEDFHDKSDKVSDKRISNKRRLVKTT